MVRDQIIFTHLTCLAPSVISISWRVSVDHSDHDYQLLYILLKPGVWSIQHNYQIARVTQADLQETPQRSIKHLSLSSEMHTWRIKDHYLSSFSGSLILAHQALENDADSQKYTFTTHKFPINTLSTITSNPVLKTRVWLRFAFNHI